jgi:hypothetical protein
VGGDCVIVRKLRFGFERQCRVRVTGYACGVCIMLRVKDWVTYAVYD